MVHFWERFNLKTMKDINEMIYWKSKKKKQMMMTGHLPRLLLLPNAFKSNFRNRKKTPGDN